MRTKNHPDIEKAERGEYPNDAKRALECARCGEDVFEGEEVYIRAFWMGRRYKTGYVCAECFRELICSMSLEELARETGTDSVTAGADTDYELWDY